MHQIQMANWTSLLTLLLLSLAITSVGGASRVGGAAHVGGASREGETLQQLDLQITLARIPPVQTYYVCQQFQVPHNETYHVTRFEPLIVNKDVVHHMLLFGCDFEMDSKGPHPCDSLDNHCRTWLVKWDTGMQGDIIMPKEAGVRFGKGSFKHLLLQVHWNNDGLWDNRTDNSGIRLFYSTHLRRYDVGNVQFGQNHIEIPSGVKDHHVTGTCSARCTSLMLPTPIYVSAVYMHMHGLGVEVSLDIRRDREITERIALDVGYNYTQPIVHTLDPPVIIEPGDDVHLTCWYDTSSGSRYRNHTVTYGKGADSEMCYAFVRYYPQIEGFYQCVQDGDRNINCDR